MDDNRLMELVETHEVLYNRLHPHYKHLDKKDEAFAEIAAELGIDDTQLVVQRYRALRDRFVRYKRIKMTTGQVKYYLPVLDKMKYLAPHVFNKKRRNKKTNSCMSDESYSMDPLQLALRDESDAAVEFPSSLPAKSPEPTGRKRLKRDAETPNHDKKSANINIDDEFSEAINCFKEVCKAREEAQKNLALHGFRQMITATIAGLNVINQTKAMLRVTEAVMQIKMEDDD